MDHHTRSCLAREQLGAALAGQKALGLAAESLRMNGRGRLT